jgi:formate hydrogenlyase subunit 3/multisubunit Na+/H+ antiporter MnhD subunit
LAVTGILYLIGCWIIFSDVLNREEFLASSTQMTGAAGVALALIILAFLVKAHKFQESMWLCL